MEGVELARRHSSDEELDNNPHDDWRTEQEALLQTYGDGIPTKSHRWVRENILRYRVYSFGLLAVLLVILFYLISLVASHGPCTYGMKSHSCPIKPTHSKATGFRRPQSDYTLDPKWNFEAKPTTRKYLFTITDEEANPDGVYRQMILINGQFPGPLIECNDGDRLVIEVENRGVNATSFHWHGIFQNGSNWMDGTVGVTQCPIAPGSSFTYDFAIKGQHGTYW